MIRMLLVELEASLELRKEGGWCPMCWCLDNEVVENNPEGGLSPI